jgi:hypothetical protein
MANTARAIPSLALALAALTACGGTRVYSHRGDTEVVAVSFDEATALSSPATGVRCHFVDADERPLADLTMIADGHSEHGWRYVCDAPTPEGASGYFVTFVNSNGDRRRAPSTGVFELR